MIMNKAVSDMSQFYDQNALPQMGALEREGPQPGACFALVGLPDC